MAFWVCGNLPGHCLAAAYSPTERESSNKAATKNRRNRRRRPVARSRVFSTLQVDAHHASSNLDARQASNKARASAGRGARSGPTSTR